MLGRREVAAEREKISKMKPAHVPHQSSRSMHTPRSQEPWQTRNYQVTVRQNQGSPGAPELVAGTSSFFSDDSPLVGRVGSVDICRLRWKSPQLRPAKKVLQDAAGLHKNMARVRAM